MPPIFWIGAGLGGCVFFISTVAGARSRTATIKTGAAIGLFMGLMLFFPLIAIGLSTS